jgi:hypothetical protein
MFSKISPRLTFSMILKRGATYQGNSPYEDVQIYVFISIASKSTDEILHTKRRHIEMVSMMNTTAWRYLFLISLVLIQKSIQSVQTCALSL